MSPIRPANAHDALSLPLVAYRGLWDKFARPCSGGALRRSYLRGVPSLLRFSSADAILADALEFVADPSVNRRRQPLFVMTNGQPTSRVRGGSGTASVDVFVIDSAGPLDATRPIYRGNSETRSVIGCYVPVGAWRRGLTAEDLGGTQRMLELLLFESVNVIDDVAAAAQCVHQENDDKALASIRVLVGSQMPILRVSDLVELDLLTRCTREAA